jgi:hypothetical protein
MNFCLRKERLKTPIYSILEMETRKQVRTGDIKT